ncbi:hypothetical protein SHT67_14360 (plasmid) [Enterococcus faecalis]|uniref:hypothetical protein n=1 Tax=Enterococcus faecalis TaxID=1351 RepID=UPI0029C814CF|nr:hypothetical protein [Enterococcus faecalis]WPH48358.1 hypothetical protein SHT67_14360 [Enterococcus faecalis]
MRKHYLEVYPTNAIGKAHTVKTFDNEVFINCWNGDFISRNDPNTRISAWLLYHHAKNVEREGFIIASRGKDTQPLRYLANPIPLKRQK